ncbi:N-formylglutamate amidohydrolase [Azospirillum sp. B506]|uniref:N-formylglutamate amidohydrolase n=1 Tax=Azospirillum sp. B506 TaxID=137721 RepID=UPI001FCB7CE1|nr:N-formylglutamate amidohydrolase [Azospirillum sp. B506]
MLVGGVIVDDRVDHLAEEQLCRHIAYDIGAAEVTRRLAARFGATAVLSGFSRLVIDPNRALEDPTAIPVVSDDVVIPGNRALDAEAQAQRVEALFKPYHAAVAAAVASWGGTRSLMAPMPVKRNRTARPWTGEDLILRISVGLEDPSDLQDDLTAVLDDLAARTARAPTA